MSSIIRVKRTESPFSNTMELCRLGLIQTRPCCFQVEVPEDRHEVHHHVIDGVDVRVVAREHDLLGGEPTADFVAPLDEADPHARARQIGGGDQAVRTSPDDHSVPIAVRRKLLEETLRMLITFEFPCHRIALSSLAGLLPTSYTRPSPGTAEIFPASGTYQGDAYHQSPGSTTPSSMRMCMRL